MNESLDFSPYLERWALQPDGEPFATHSSRLLPVRHRGAAAMLKISSAEEERFGHVLLNWWDGQGAARVLAYDHQALLMERATGGRSLLEMVRRGDDDEATRILCQAIERIHAPRPGPLPELTPLERWFDSLYAAERRYGGLYVDCANAARYLLETAREQRPLHGDIHHGNVLDFGERGWQVIDPKRLYGERGYDYANLFTNPDAKTAQAPGRFERQLEIVIAASGLQRLGFADEQRYTGVEPVPAPGWFAEKLPQTRWQAVDVQGEAITPFKDATHYNNFYEFGPNKGDPAENASALKTEPWSVVIDGEVGKPGTYALEDFVKPYQLEERIYRLRCVEAWSMVIPWLGFPLADLLKRVEPNGQAKFVRFETLQRPEQMVGQRSGFSVIDWPYMEGLRMDEAMHPLAILAVGMYGRLLPNQNGAPLRLVVPWKYGFKSIKSIVRISLVREQPKTTWESIAANEYGFYANVNPQVDHPRWSQARERRLPSGLFSPNVRDTQMFNGYGSEVASLYSGMDLRKYY